VLGFKVFDEPDLDKAGGLLQGARACRWRMGRAALSRAHAAHRAIRMGHSAGILRQMDRLPPIHQKYALPGREAAADRPLQLLLARRRCLGRLLQRDGFPRDGIYRRRRNRPTWAAWMHRKGGVHDIAFTNGTGPRLHHLAFWVPTPLNIIDLLDLMSTTGYLAQYRTRAGPSWHFQRVLPVYPRSGWSSDRNLLLGLPDG
jgi:catechol 2,3-dioxygenase